MKIVRFNFILDQSDVPVTAASFPKARSYSNQASNVFSGLAIDKGGLITIWTIIEVSMLECPLLLTLYTF